MEDRIEEHQIAEESSTNTNSNLVSVAISSTSLGVTLVKETQRDGSCKVAVVKSVPDGLLANAGVGQGAYLVAVDGHDVMQLFPYKAMLGYLRTSRPIKLTFERPGLPMLQQQTQSALEPEKYVPSSESDEQRVGISRVDQQNSTVRDALAQDIIDLDLVRSFGMRGFPDAPGVRSICWRLLLGLLPANRSLWEDELKRHRDLYETYKQELIVGNSNVVSVTSSRPQRLQGQAWYEQDNVKRIETSTSVIKGKDQVIECIQSDTDSILCIHNQPELSSCCDDEVVRFESLNLNQSAHLIPESMESVESGLECNEVNEIVEEEEKDVTTQKGQYKLDDHENNKSMISASEQSMEIGSQQLNQIATDQPHITTRKPVLLSELDPLARRHPINPSTNKTLATMQIDEVPSNETVDCETDDKVPSNETVDCETDDKVPSNETVDCETDDKELREEIWKDVQRTHPGLHFFTTDTYNMMERILFVYAKLNPGVRYVQGMNEVLAPLLYVLGSDSPPGMIQHAEADSFFCFSYLMSEIRDLFIKNLDATVDGLNGKLQEMMRAICKVDKEVYDRLVQQQLDPQYFGLRWITTLLAREFDLPETVRMWDSLFSDANRFSFLTHMCCAMVVLQRDKLLQGSFGENMKLLQNYPVVQPHTILQEAHRIQNLLSIPSVSSTTRTMASKFARSVVENATISQTAGSMMNKLASITTKTQLKESSVRLQEKLRSRFGR